jgi:hypothetical protein
VNDIPSSTVKVKNFKLESSAKESNGGPEYYTMEYSFEIFNRGAAPLELSGYIINTNLLSPSWSEGYGAGSTTLPDIIILPGKSHTIEYHANTGLLNNPLDVDGWHFQIAVFPAGNFANSLVWLDYIVHVN